MNTRRRMLELQQMEEQKLIQELRKIEGADYCFQMLSVFKISSVICFLGNLVMIILASIAECRFFNTNSTLVYFTIISLTVASIVLLLFSIVYKNKTMKILEQYYSKN